jgi:hypothetical protein
MATKRDAEVSACCAPPLRRSSLKSRLPTGAAEAHSWAPGDQWIIQIIQLAIG